MPSQSPSGGRGRCGRRHSAVLRLCVRSSTSSIASAYGAQSPAPGTSVASAPAAQARRSASVVAARPARRQHPGEHVAGAGGVDRLDRRGRHVELLVRRRGRIAPREPRVITRCGTGHASSRRLGFVDDDDVGDLGQCAPGRRGRRRRRRVDDDHGARRPRRPGQRRSRCRSGSPTAAAPRRCRRSTARTCGRVHASDARWRRARRRCMFSAAGVDDDRRGTAGPRHSDDAVEADAVGVADGRAAVQPPASVPSAATSCTSAPARAAATAWLPPLPPGRRHRRRQHGLAGPRQRVDREREIDVDTAHHADPRRHGAHARPTERGVTRR